MLDDALIFDAVTSFSTKRLPLPDAPPNPITSIPLNLAKPFILAPDDVIGKLV